MGCWHGNIAPSSVEVSVIHDKVGWNPITSEITRACGMVHTDGEILVHFKMEMRRIHPVVITDCAELLASLELLAFPYSDSIQMGIERIGKVKLSLFDPGMADDHYIAPGDMNITSQHNHPVGYGRDGAAKSLGAAPVCYPILT